MKTKQFSVVFLNAAAEPKWFDLRQIFKGGDMLHFIVTFKVMKDL